MAIHGMETVEVVVKPKMGIPALAITLVTDANTFLTIKTNQHEKANQKTQPEQKNYFKSYCRRNEQTCWWIYGLLSQFIHLREPFLLQLR
jgi:hypothetical protein